jgi:ABC-type phosphate/phosphonate transport system substrate-binding protein
MIGHDPVLEQQIRIVATTDPAPAPFLVAAATCPDEIVAKLQAALLSFGSDPACASLRDQLCLDGFAPVTTSDYELMLCWDSEARAAGYSQPA